MKKYLLILSGWAVDKFVWNPIITSLANDFEIFVIDWNDVVSMDEFEQKVYNLINEKEIDRFSIMGWSLGSLAALDISVSHSSKIDNMILFSPTSKFVRDETSNYKMGWNRKIVNRMIFMLKEYPEKTINSFYENLFSDTEVKNGYSKIFLEKISRLNKKQSIQSLVLGLEYLINKDVRKNIKDVHIPTLIIHGDRDMICPIESGKYVNERLRKSELIILRQTGHMPFYTKSNECYDSIKNYISNKEGR